MQQTASIKHSTLVCMKNEKTEPTTAFPSYTISLNTFTSSMPGIITNSPFHHITVKKLHPTFGAEISGIDFSKPIGDETFAEVLTAISKVRHRIS